MRSRLYCFHSFVLSDTVLTKQSLQFVVSWIKGRCIIMLSFLLLFTQRGTGVVCFSFFFWLRVLNKTEYSAFESTLNSAIVSYRIVSYITKLQ